MGGIGEEWERRGQHLISFSGDAVWEFPQTLYDKISFAENYKIAQEKLVNHPVFATVSSSVRKTDIKLKEVQQNM